MPELIWFGSGIISTMLFLRYHSSRYIDGGDILMCVILLISGCVGLITVTIVTICDLISRFNYKFKGIKNSLYKER